MYNCICECAACANPYKVDWWLLGVRAVGERWGVNAMNMFQRDSEYVLKLDSGDGCIPL